MPQTLAAFAIGIATGGGAVLLSLAYVALRTIATAEKGRRP